MKLQLLILLPKICINKDSVVADFVFPVPDRSLYEQHVTSLYHSTKKNTLMLPG